MDFEFVAEEKPLISANEANQQNDCLDNTIKEECKEYKFCIEGESMDVIRHEDEKDYQKLIKCEDLVIKHEEDDLDESDDIDICPECTIIVAVSGNSVQMGIADRAAQTVPKGTLVLRYSDLHGFGIYSRRHLKKGVRLGPYEGYLTKIETIGGYSWKLRGGRLVDASDETSSNYLRYVNYATHLSEENLVAFQYKGELYYRTRRDIEKGEELLIYFDGNPDETYYKPNEENLEDEFYICRFCKLVFKFETHRDRHQMFCKTQTVEGYIGSLCKHFAVSSNQEHTEDGTQIEPVISTRKNVHDQQKNVKCTTNCNDKTDSKYPLNRDRLEHQPTKCKDCNYESNTKSNLRFHKKKHNQKNTLKCADCDFVTYYKSHLNIHRQTHETTKMKCADCDFETFYKASLYTHRQKHEPTNILKCEECGYETNIKWKFQSHITIHRNILKCADCDFETFHKIYLNKHRRQKHESTNLIKCGDCDFITYNKNSLKQHRQKHEPTNFFKCADCDFVTYIKGSLSRHRQKHEPTNFFKCTDCDFVTYIKGNLIRHRQKHEPTEIFKCPDCDYETCYKYNLITHRQKHELANKLKCEDCTFETNVKWKLHYHKMKHNQRIDLKCKDCDYKTYYKYKLRLHRLKHENSNLFKCADCNFVTYIKSNLNRHRQKHEPTKMFKCADCDYETCYKYNLTKHRKKHELANKKV